MNKPENPFQKSVLEMHPMNQVPYHVGHSMGLLNVDPQHDLYCSATQATSYRLFHQGWSDGRVLAESQPAFIELPSQLVRTLADRVTQAVFSDEAEEGCDNYIGIGLPGPRFSAILVEMAGYEAEAFALQDQVDEANSSVTALEQRIAELEAQNGKLTQDFASTVEYMNEGCICGRAPAPKHPVDPRLLRK